MPAGWKTAISTPVYMLFEGRRFWPTSLFALGRRRERARLVSLLRRMRRYDSDRLPSAVPRGAREKADRIYPEAAVDLSGFALDRVTSMPRVIWPTRLGNLIAAYEQYPRRKYGLDAVFHWPRLWVTISKELRDEIDNQQAQADGLLYISAALMVAAVVLLLCAAVDTIAPHILMYDETASLDIAAAVLCIGGSLLLYRIALYFQSQFGELFKSVFDQHRSRLNLDEVVDLVANLTADPGLPRRIMLVRNIAAWRLLRWHRVRLPSEKINRRARLP